MPSSLCLLVLLGAGLVSAFPHQFMGESKESQESIALDLGLTKPEVGNRPLFSSVIRSINTTTTCQRSDDVQLINATLDVYHRIFSSVLQHQHQRKAPSLLSALSDSRRSEVVVKLQHLQKTMETLRSQFNNLHLEKEKQLAKIQQIKVDDLLSQKKALAEYNEVYQTASMVYTQSCH